MNTVNSYLFFGPSGNNLFITEFGNKAIREINITSGNIVTFLNSSQGLDGPQSITFDSSKNAYVANYNKNQVLKVDAVTKAVSVFAGTGVAGYLGEGGLASLAQLYAYWVIYHQDAIYIADQGNSCIRMVNLTSNMISTVAGMCTSSGFSGDGGLAVNAKLNKPSCVIFDTSGQMFIADHDNYR